MIKNGSIIDAIQFAVNEICEKEYSKDSCPPSFIVSVYQGYTNDKITENKILLTIDHSGIKHSRQLFPKLECEYGYDSLNDEMRYLYNSTM